MALWKARQWTYLVTRLKMYDVTIFTQPVKRRGEEKRRNPARLYKH